MMTTYNAGTITLADKVTRPFRTASAVAPGDIPGHLQVQWCDGSTSQVFWPFVVEIKTGFGDAQPQGEAREAPALAIGRRVRVRNIDEDDLLTLLNPGTIGQIDRHDPNDPNRPWRIRTTSNTTAWCATSDLELLE